MADIVKVLSATAQAVGSIGLGPLGGLVGQGAKIADKLAKSHPKEAKAITDKLDAWTAHNISGMGIKGGGSAKEQLAGGKAANQRLESH